MPMLIFQFIPDVLLLFFTAVANYLKSEKNNFSCMYSEFEMIVQTFSSF